MSLGERIKQVRKALNLTQREFGERIGMKQNSVAQVEMGRNTSEQTILTICRVFDVNEDWLRNGKGNEMFKRKPSNLLDGLAKEFNIGEFGRTVIEKMLRLDEKQWQAVCEFMSETIADLSKGTAASSVGTQCDEPVVTAKNEPTISATSHQIADSSETISVPKAEWEEMKHMLMEQQKQIDAINQEDAIRDLLEGKSNLSTLWSE